MVYDADIDVVGITVGSLDDEGAGKLFCEEALKGRAIAICVDEAAAWGDARVLARGGEFGGLPG